MLKWIDVNDAKPEKGTKVLVCLISPYAKPQGTSPYDQLRCCRWATYVPAETAKGDVSVTEGWYDLSVGTDHKKIKSAVTHWARPTAPPS
jgi:hypothetical protein